MSETTQKLSQRINDGQATVGVIGLGYVGLPLAIAFADKGFPVLGFDVDQDKVDAVMDARSYIKHLDAEGLTRVVQKGALEATADFSRLKTPDVILICVPTPLTPHPPGGRTSGT